MYHYISTYYSFFLVFFFFPFTWILNYLMRGIQVILFHSIKGSVRLMWPRVFHIPKIFKYILMPPRTSLELKLHAWIWLLVAFSIVFGMEGEFWSSQGWRGFSPLYEKRANPSLGFFLPPYPWSGRSQKEEKKFLILLLNHK